MYVQIDNTAINKSYVIISALGALNLLGVTRKVKISYLLVGHSHTLGDGVMGSFGNTINDINMPTFETFRVAVIDAGKKLGYAHIDCFRIVGITDYKLLFSDIDKNPHNMHGITHI